jgi:glycosyltransferase involved in cell wall biosynthesis
MISIVMAYFNRKELLDKTLESINKSNIKDYELIIVDDASDDPLVCEGVKVIRIDKKDKWYHNPCVPFNMGFKVAKGDVVLIQNPECYHVGDILSYIQNNIKPNHYLSFACYAMNRRDTDEFNDGKFPVLNNWMFKNPERNGWYNHSYFRPSGYHFCSAIMKLDLDMIGGFDERYAGGISYDDDDFIRRIKEKMQVSIINNPYVLHQYHNPMSYSVDGMNKLHEINKKLFNNGILLMSKQVDLSVNRNPIWNLNENDYSWGNKWKAPIRIFVKIGDPPVYEKTIPKPPDNIKKKFTRLSDIQKGKKECLIRKGNLSMDDVLNNISH